MAQNLSGKKREKETPTKAGKAQKPGKRDTLKNQAGKTRHPQNRAGVACKDCAEGCGMAPAAARNEAATAPRPAIPDHPGRAALRLPRARSSPIHPALRSRPCPAFARRRKVLPTRQPAPHRAGFVGVPLSCPSPPMVSADTPVPCRPAAAAPFHPNDYSCRRSCSLSKRLFSRIA